MSKENFELLTDKLKRKAKYLYFHLMGEPLTHPLLPEFIISAKAKGFIPILTSNGTLLEKQGDKLIEAAPFKISISIQSHEGNISQGNISKANISQDQDSLYKYLLSISAFAKKAAPKIIIVFRLWNIGGKETENKNILDFLHMQFPGNWRKNRSGYAIADKVFIEFGEAFDWPDVNGAEKGIGIINSDRDKSAKKIKEKEEEEKTEGNSEFFCYALRKQIGILVDGTVVPCCLDSDGAIALGNLLTEDLDLILNSKRAKAIYDGFSMHTPVEELCKNCGYASKTKNFHGTKQSPYASS